MDKTNSEDGDIKVICPDDCGNSPRKLLLKKLTVAFPEGDRDFVTNVMTDDVFWNVVGNKEIHGKDNFINCLKQTKTRFVEEIHIRNIITHGSTGAVNGTLIIKDKRSYAFCDVYNFTGAGKNSKIKEITSYIIETSPK